MTGPFFAERNSVQLPTCLLAKGMNFTVFARPLAVQRFLKINGGLAAIGMARWACRPSECPRRTMTGPIAHRSLNNAFRPCTPGPKPRALLRSTRYYSCEVFLRSPRLQLRTSLEQNCLPAVLPPHATSLPPLDLPSLPTALCVATFVPSDLQLVCSPEQGCRRILMPPACRVCLLVL